MRHLLEEDVELSGGDVVRLSEDGVVRREAEDGGPRRGDAPGDHSREPVEAVLAPGAPAQEVLAGAVHGFPVQLQLRLGQVERRR